MSVEYYSKSYFDLIHLLDGLDTLTSRNDMVNVFLQDKPLCGGNPAFVGVAFSLAHEEIVTVADVAKAIVGSLNIGNVPDLTVVDAYSFVYSFVEDSSIFSLADYMIFRHIATVHNDGVEPEAAIHRVAYGADWYPLSRLTLLALSVVNTDAFLDIDAEIGEDLSVLVDSVTVAFRDVVYGTMTSDQRDLVVSAFQHRSHFIRGVVKCLCAVSTATVVDVEGIWPVEIDFSAHAVAQMVQEGFDYESAVVASGINLAEELAREEADYHSRVDRSDPSVAQVVTEPPMSRLLDSYLDVYAVSRAVVESIEGLIFHIRHEVDEYAAAVVAPAIMLMDAAAKVGTALHSIFNQVVGFFLEVADSLHWFNREVRSVVGVILYGLIDLIDIRHRRNPKSVWALLTSRKGARLSRSEMFLTQLATFSHRPSPSYEAWAGDMIRRLAKSGIDTSALSITPPARAVYYPRNTFGPADNNDLELAVEVNFHETAREARRVQQALAKGAPRGIDSAWLATATHVQSSIDRYVVPRPTLSLEAKQMLRDAADAVFDHMPQLYDRPQPMSVAAAMLAVEWKYSAGLPFLPAIRTRQQLKNSAWYQAIAKAAEDIIEGGLFPDVAFHAFPKTDVVNRQKVVDDPSAIRTVTAGDRITCIAAMTIMGEVNKRVAPLEAWVANQLPRREGGAQELYKAISSRPCIVTTDGWRFDSQVPPEVMSLGSVRLFERGIEGWWGAKAATSFVEAYYSAVSHGLVVNLMDGNVVRKTGGGGTGSAFTSSDNRNWVEIVLVASWSLAFDQPPSDFWKHVTLAHASDDVIFSIDEEYRARLQDWQDTILLTYGLRFDFDLQDDVDGFLHLRLVSEAMLDRDMYDQLGLPVPAYPVMHDPLRLALKRSDYRSDRMRHSYLMAADHIATQCFGHLLLVAHDIDTYGDILEEAIEATGEYLGYFFKDVEFSKYYNGSGQLIGTDYTVSDIPSNYILRDMARRFDDPHSHQARVWMQGRLKTARQWIRCHRYPSYLEVFKAWVTPEDWNKFRPAQKKWSKLVANLHVNVPAIDLVQAGMLTIADITAKVPTGLTRWSGPDIVPNTRPLVTNSFMVEMFIYEKYRENHGGVAPSYGEFQAKCRESPYGSVTDPNGFWNARSDFHGWEHDPRRETDMNVLQGRMLMFTFMYGLIDYAQSALRMNRFLGFVVAMFFLLVRDLDKWYSLLHLAYWLGYGEASVVISNMSPRDPFVAQKMLALLMTATVPLFLFRIFSRTADICKWIADASTVFYSGYKVTVLTATATNIALAAPGDRWNEAVTQVLAARNPDQRVVRIQAGMGSGKSTSLPARLLEVGNWQTVFIVVPTVSLVVNYQNAFIDPSEILRLNTNEDWALLPKKIVVLTAHRLLGAQLDAQYAGRSLFIFDEAHMATTAQCAAWLRWSSCYCMLVTGTPGGRLWAHGSTVSDPSTGHVTSGRTYVLPDPPAPGRTIITYDTEQPMNPTRSETVVEWLRSLMKAHEREVSIGLEGARRFAVYHPFVDTCSDLRLLLERSGYLASMTTANSPGISPSGVVVGTWVIVTGVNFDPPIYAMIDCGLEAYLEPSWTDVDANYGGLNSGFRDNATRLRIGWSSPATRDQVAARTGRTTAGWVFRPPRAGTGPHREPSIDILVALEHHDLSHAHWRTLGLLDVLGVTIELVQNPRPIGSHPLLSWVWFDSQAPVIRRHAALLALLLLFGTALGSMREAIVGVQSPQGLSHENRQLLARLQSIFPTATADIVLMHVPADLKAMTMHVGFRVAAPVGSSFYGGRPAVYYPCDRDVRPRLRPLISVSGLYPRSLFYPNGL